MIKSRNWDHNWDRNWGRNWDRNWGHNWDRNWDGSQWCFNKSIEIDNPSLSVAVPNTVQVLNELLVHFYFFIITSETCVLK